MFFKLRQHSPSNPHLGLKFFILDEVNLNSEASVLEVFNGLSVTDAISKVPRRFGLQVADPLQFLRVFCGRC